METFLTNHLCVDLLTDYFIFIIHFYREQNKKIKNKKNQLISHVTDLTSCFMYLMNVFFFFKSPRLHQSAGVKYAYSTNIFEGNGFIQIQQNHWSQVFKSILSLKTC